MTLQALTPTPPYTVNGTGPYAITHAYDAAADITAAVVLSGQRTELVRDTDFFVSPDGDDTGGNVTLSAGAATTYDTGTLYIARQTEADQAWQGIQGAREASLEAQLDRLAMAHQDTRRDLGRSIRLDYDIGPITLQPDTVIAVDATGQIYSVAPSVLALQAPDSAALQAYIDGLIANTQPLSANLTQLAAGPGDNFFFVGNASSGYDAKAVSNWAQNLLASGGYYLGVFHHKITDLVASHAAGWTMTIDDRGKLHLATATQTVNLMAAASAVVAGQAGYRFAIWATAGTTTLDPSGAETINGAPTLTLKAGQVAEVWCDGTGWRALVRWADSRPFESAEQTIASAGGLTIAHGLGVVPSRIEAFLKCQVDEAGYVAGEIIPANLNSTTAGTNRFNAAFASATDIEVRFSDDAKCFTAANRLTGSNSGLNNANWKLIVRAWR